MGLKQKLKLYFYASSKFPTNFLYNKRFLKTQPIDNRGPLH